MNEKKSGISPFLFLGLGFLLFIVVASYFLITFLNDTILSKPEIDILQPTSPQAIPLGDGFLLVTYAKSKQGLHRVEFYMDQVLINQQIPPSDSAQEMLAQFAWLPQAIGAYDLSFIAYDMQNNPSERASIPVAVIAPNLPEQVMAQIEQEFGSLPLQNVAGSNGDSEQPDGSIDDRQDEEENGIWNIENFEMGEGVVVVWEGDQNQPPNTPPFITDFNINQARDGNNRVVDVYVAAKDDTGLQFLLLRVYRQGRQDLIDRILVDCQGMPTCDLSGQFSLSDGAYTNSAVALDINDNSSAIRIENVEVVPNHEVPEPPVLIVENQQFNIPVNLLQDIFIDENNRIQLPPQFRGGGNVDPFGEIDPQLGCPPFCPPASLDDVNISVEQSWRVNRFLEAQVTLTVPPGFIVEDLEAPIIWVNLREHSRTPRSCAIALSEEVLLNGKNTTCIFDLHNLCGGDLNFFPEISAGDLFQSEGNSTTIQALPCPPIKPQLTQLHATTNCGGADKCITVTWSIPDEQADSYTTDHLVLRKKYYDFGIFEMREDEFIFSPDQQAKFIDIEVIDGRVYEYNLKSVSAEGVESIESRMNIKTPLPNDPWVVVSTDWQESR